MIELDIEYDNGFRETVGLRLGEQFTMPLNGRVVNITPQPAPYGTATSQPRCECHDCTQARAHPMVFYDPASVDLSHIVGAVPVKRSPRDIAIDQLLLRKKPHHISEDDVQCEMNEAIMRHAAATERERCAKIADEYASDPHGSNPSCATGEAIAARIRSGNLEVAGALSHQIKEAVAAERKRCEQIVVDTTVDTTNPGQGISGWNQACAVIAGRIRSGK